MPATAPSKPLGRYLDAEGFLRFMRLTGVAEVAGGEVSFPPGILWPYTSDLRRVRAAVDDAGEVPTDALLAAIAALHERIAFAPDGAGREVAAAYIETEALQRRLSGHSSDKRTSRGSRTAS